MSYNPLTVLTFNIAGLPLPLFAHARVRKFCETVEGMKELSIINLQEVHSYVLLWHLQRGLSSFPYATFKSGVFGPKGGLVTFSKSPFDKCEFVPFSNRPHKGMLVAQVSDSALAVVNTHLSANTDGDWSRTNRFYETQRVQLQELNELVHGIAAQKVVLSGDLNLARGCELFEDFDKSCGLIDAFALDSEPTYIGHFLPKDRTPQAIDYIYVSCASGDCDFTMKRSLFKDRETLWPGIQGFVSNHIALCVTVRFDAAIKGTAETCA
jgi:endonuclease/exonuclease/phosphatase family metal-dependent hydrolase